MGTEKERRAPSVRLDPRIQVADTRVDSRARVVLVDSQRKSAEVLDHLVGHRSLFAGRARDTGELEEEPSDLGEPVLHGRDLRLKAVELGVSNGLQAGFKRPPGRSPDVL